MYGTAKIEGARSMDDLRALAATKDHRIPDHLLGLAKVTDAQFDSMASYLRRCRDLAPGAREEEMGRARTRENVEPVRQTFADIPAGFYATPSATGNNDYDFWKVTEGRKPGVRFAKRVLGGGDDRYPRLEQISNQQQVAALRTILQAGIETAANDYADNQTRCKRCGLQLTDQASRDARMGPVCRER